MSPSSPVDYRDRVQVGPGYPGWWRNRRRLGGAIVVLMLAQAAAVITSEVSPQDDGSAMPSAPATTVPADPRPAVPAPQAPPSSMAPPALPTAGAPPTSVASTSPIGGGQSAPPPAGGDCGPPIYKADGSPWQCSFADDFNGTELDRSKWQVIVTKTSGYRSGTECFVDRPDTISVRDGTLRLTIVETGSAFYCESHVPLLGHPTSVISGTVSTLDRFSQTYGRFEARVRMPPIRVPGVQTSIWMWPQDHRYGSLGPASGEIDIAEWFSQYPDLAIPHLHYNGDRSNVTRSDCHIDRTDELHNYALEWSSTSLRFIYDGQLCLENTNWTPWAPLRHPQPFDQPFAFFVTPVLGTGTNTSLHAAALLPATTTVEWVRIWR